MKLKKELVHDLIRITKKYYRTGDIGILPAMSKVGKALEEKCKVSYIVTDLIKDLAMFAQRSGVGTYEDIYKALAIFGVIVE